jgi:hypothetical protein
MEIKFTSIMELKNWKAITVIHRKQSPKIIALWLLSYKYGSWLGRSMDPYNLAPKLILPIDLPIKSVFFVQTFKLVVDRLCEKTNYPVNWAATVQSRTSFK